MMSLFTAQGQLVGDNLTRHRHTFQFRTSNGVWKIRVSYSLRLRRKSSIDIATSGYISGREVSRPKGPSGETNGSAWGKLRPHILGRFVRETSNPRARGCQLWLSTPRLTSLNPPNSPKTLYFQCRGRDSNPHGTFAPEDFKSLCVVRKCPQLLMFSTSAVKL